MCGITGIFSLSGRPIQNAEERIRRMTMMLKHRGPDNQGFYVSNDRIVALGNTRLAIVDPACELKQPLTTFDNKLVLSFNGEIYNYVDLRKQLEQRGIRFRSRMDTEVLLEGLRLEAEDFLKKLDGMWAFALYDSDNRRLILSRDILGERHIFYHVQNEELVFASEVKPLLVDAESIFDIDFESFIISLQYFSAPPGRSMIKGIYRMLPGHNIKAEIGKGIDIYRYRRLHPEKWFDFFNSKPTIEKVMETFEETFHRACRKRLPLDVDYMTTLSGGLDSTLICLYASDFGKNKIRTVYGQSAGKPARNLDEVLDELEASNFTAKKLNTLHSHIFLNSDEVIPVLTRLSENAFEGMFDSAVASFEMLAWHTREKNLKVILISDGPDDLLGYPKDLNGYKLDNMRANDPVKFEILRLISMTKAGRYLLKRIGLIKSVISPLTSYNPFIFSPLHKSWGLDTIDKILTNEQIINSSRYYGTVSPDYSDIIPYLDYAQMRALSYATLSLPDMFNLRSDKAFMRASIEVRLPYQAPEMAELMIAMPTEYRFNNGNTTKYVMRKLVDRNIGSEIAYRSKHGFSAPLWCSSNVYKAMKYDEIVKECSAFNEYPFKEGIKNTILKPQNQDMLWPFYVFAKTYDQLKNRKYINDNA
jgi:asparagine synthase (glutamine-hydrolysing)